MRIEILSEAADDLVAGAKFYERKRAGLGEYFLNSLYSDIDSLLLYAGIHRLVFGFHRALSKRFPFAIFYRFDRDKELVRVLPRVGFAPRLALDQGTTSVDRPRSMIKAVCHEQQMSNRRNHNS